MSNYMNFLKNITVDTPMPTILHYYLYPVKMNVKFYERSKNYTVKIKKINYDIHTLEKKIASLLQKDVSVNNPTLRGMRIRLDFFENQKNKILIKLNKTVDIMHKNFYYGDQMTSHLVSLGILDQVLNTLRQDLESLKLLNAYRTAYNDLYGKPTE